jgi:uncharacterized phage protein (TIGR01671 family)
MKREILFRGKRVDNDKWVEGFAVKWETWNNSTETWTGHYGIVSTGWCNMKPNDCLEVIPETVGQFTGLTDKNGVKIFEGDVLKGGIYLEYEVKWDHEEWGWNITEAALNFYIIGNIHDSPELLA